MITAGKGGNDGPLTAAAAGDRAAPWAAGGWRRELAQAVREPAELERLLGLAAGTVSGAAGIDFPLRVPRAYLGRIRAGDPHDPLLLQVLPAAAELDDVPGWGSDPLAETDPAVAVVPGVLRKYARRALLITTGACAVHCRYCFRREFPYQEQRWQSRRDRALDYLERDSEITEVILSGGDPLSLTDDVLEPLVERLQSIEHLQRLRIHTRLPIVLPSRIDDRLLGWVGRRRRPLVVVVHCNHPREIDDDVVTALDLLAARGVTLLNQAVLLRGVNDRVDVLEELSERLFEARVLPYYLHLLDPVRGAAHFDVPAGEGSRLVEELRARLPGYLVPRLVRELPGAPSKTPVGG